MHTWLILNDKESIDSSRLQKSPLVYTLFFIGIYYAKY